MSLIEVNPLVVAEVQTVLFILVAMIHSKVNRILLLLETKIQSATRFAAFVKVNRAWIQHLLAWGQSLDHNDLFRTVVKTT